MLRPRPGLLSILLLLSIAQQSWGAEKKTVTLLHFSDYHSHALPFYTEEGERGGIARANAYLESEKARGALVFNGGDTMNSGAPAWSDRYRCVEWMWWNGIVDAMAFGNHDADYGRVAFEACRGAVRFPILSANTPGFQRSSVFERQGIRIGVFAVAGADFPRLVTAEGFTFDDSVAAARETVRELRERERVHAVIMIGHQYAAEDEKIARAVPGIDVIFGSHGHLRQELTKIAGTDTWTIAPWQYLAYISRLQLTFEDTVLKRVVGGLVAVDARMAEDEALAQLVANMQERLERDPKYSHYFTRIATLSEPMTVGELAARTLEAMRRSTGAHVALSTKSSFRRPLPSGTLNLELLRAALPYDNEMVVCEMPQGDWQRVLEAAGDSFVAGQPPADGPVRAVTTDYAANAALRDVFQCDNRKTGRRVREELRQTFTP